MYRYFVLIIALSFCSPVFAKEYSITDLLSTAEQNSGNIEASEYFAQSQLGIAKQQKYWNNPSVGYDGGNARENGFNVSQTIPFANKLKRKYNIEEAEYKILQTKKQDTALLVKAEVFTLAYRYYGIQKKIELFEKRIVRLASVDRYLSNITLVSPTKRSQAHIVKDKISLLERDLIELQNELYQTWNRMNVFLKLDEKPLLNIKWQGKNPIDKTDFINTAIQNNLDLKTAKQLVDKYKSEVSFAKLEQMPDVSVSVSQYKDNSALSQNTSARVGISLSVPLFNRNQSKISGLETKVKAGETEYRFQETQLTNFIKNEISEYDTLLKIAGKFPTSKIDTVLNRLSSANNDFQKGILDFITYIELDTQEYEVIETVINTQTNIAATYARLMIQRGEFIVPDYE